MIYFNLMNQWPPRTPLPKLLWEHGRERVETASKRTYNFEIVLYKEFMLNNPLSSLDDLRPATDLIDRRRFFIVSGSQIGPVAGRFLRHAYLDTRAEWLLTSFGVFSISVWEGGNVR